MSVQKRGEKGKRCQEPFFWLVLNASRANLCDHKLLCIIFRFAQILRKYLPVTDIFLLKNSATPPQSPLLLHNEFTDGEISRIKFGDGEDKEKFIRIYANGLKENIIE